MPMNCRPVHYFLMKLYRDTSRFAIQDFANKFNATVSLTKFVVANYNSWHRSAVPKMSCNSSVDWIPRILHVSIRTIQHGTVSKPTIFLYLSCRWLPWIYWNFKNQFAPLKISNRFCSKSHNKGAENEFKFKCFSWNSSITNIYRSCRVH